jgi:UDPglucose--hexose-1-phosphate uridylyltransferase
MPEFRLNSITGEWVLIVEECRKPEDLVRVEGRRNLPDFRPDCPFCPGNEKRTPEALCVLPGEGRWRIRVVPNKFARLGKSGGKRHVILPLRSSMNGVGIHEVIIETPCHHATTATMPINDLSDVIRTYMERLLEAYRDPRVEHVVIFKNHGPSAGTSVAHSHSQLVGLPFLPRQFVDRIASYQKFLADTGSCIMCEALRDELRYGARIVSDTAHFVSFIPYAALSAFHIWIVPKRHTGSLVDIRPEEQHDLAKNLKTTMEKIYYGLGDPDFNYVLRSGRPEEADSPYIHWYMSVVPRVARASGFELGSGIYLNPLAPERSAAFLNAVRLPEREYRSSGANLS